MASLNGGTMTQYTVMAEWFAGCLVLAQGVAVSPASMDQHTPATEIIARTTPAFLPVDQMQSLNGGTLG
jgi:hypothetical protein